MADIIKFTPKSKTGLPVSKDEMNAFMMESKVFIIVDKEENKEISHFQCRPEHFNESLLTVLEHNLGLIVVVEAEFTGEPMDEDPEEDNDNGEDK